MLGDQAKRKFGFGGVMLIFMVVVLAACGGGAAADPTETAGDAVEQPAAEAVDLKLDVVATGTQSIPVYVIQKLGLDQKNGINIVVNENSGAGGANWTAIKTGAADGIITNWLDIARNREQTVPVYAVAPFLGWSNGVLVPADSPIAAITDLQGLKMGVYNAKSLDWVFIRSAVQAVGGFDPAAENEVTEGAPGLILGLLEQNQVDAILNYGDMNTKMEGTGAYKVAFETADILEDLGLNKASPFLFYGFTETYINEHPETVRAFVAAYNEAIEFIRTDDAIWNEIAKEKFDIEDEAGIANLRDTLRESIYKELPATADADARAMFQWLIDSGNEELLGVSELPETIFWDGN